MMTLVPGCQKEVKPTGTITLYTSVPTAIIEELKQEFEAENPGVYLEIYRKGTSAVVEKINEEIAAGQIQADVIWVANFTVGEELKEKGVLLAHMPSEAAEIPDILKDETGYYYAGRLLIMVVAYNTDTVTTKPTGSRKGEESTRIAIIFWDASWYLGKLPSIKVAWGQRWLALRVTLSLEIGRMEKVV